MGRWGRGKQDRRKKTGQRPNIRVNTVYYFTTLPYIGAGVREIQGNCCCSAEEGSRGEASFTAGGKGVTVTRYIRYIGVSGYRYIGKLAIHTRSV